MSSRRLNVIVTAAVLFSTIQPIMPAALAQTSDYTWASPDVDGDGLPNTTEQTNWCNAVGCFQTNAQDADSDNDGLTDGEEKLFDSNPTNSASPGIYVVYDDQFKTKQYYPWQQYGHKLIARGDAFTPPNPDLLDVQYGYGTNLDAVVIRRGTTFSVGGPQDQTLVVSKTLTSLTTLTPARDPFTGRWKISVPGNSTVGRYSLQLGGRSMDLFVIFELPTPAAGLTQQAIDRFLYDDNRATLGDEISILVDTKEYPPDPGGPPYSSTLVLPEEATEGATYEFSNQQFNRYIFEGFVMPAVNGRSTQKEAIDSLVTRVDQLTVFRNPHPRQSAWRVLNPGTDPRQQCSNISGLLSAFARSAGVVARPIVTDWHADTFDHADELWLNGGWYVYRGYKTFEMNDSGQPEGDVPLPASCVNQGTWPACGTDNYYTRFNWGKNRYEPWYTNNSFVANGIGNVLVSAPANWTETGRAYRWVTWDRSRILSYASRIETLHVPYWSYYGWTQEPFDYGDPTGSNWPALPGPAPTLLSATASNSQVTLTWTPVATATSYSIYYQAGNGSNLNKFHDPLVTGFTTTSGVVTGLTNGTQYGFAVVSVGPNGESFLSNKLTATPVAPPNPPTGVTAVAGDGQVTVSWNPVSGATSYNLYYQAGATVTKLTGTLITGVTSPHVVTGLTNGQQYAFAVAAVGPGGEGNLSAVATATPLPPLPGAPTNIAAVPGDVQVTVSWDSVSGATSYNLYYAVGSTVTKLTGTQIPGVTSPYAVTSLVNDTQYAFAVAAQNIAGEGPLSAVVTATPTAGGGGGLALPILRTDPNAQPIHLGEVTAEYGIDPDGDGRFDQLVLEVQVTVNRPGVYWLLGDLGSASYDPGIRYSGGVIANALSKVNLAAGAQTVKLTFDGKSIGMSRSDGPYRLSRLRVTDVVDPDQVAFAEASLDRRTNLYTTAAYSAAQFETAGALLSRQYRQSVFDSDRDGRPDTLVIVTGIDVQQPGTYFVAASLFDAQGQYLGRASWRGNGPQVTLNFPNVAGALGPFTVRNIDLNNSAGRSVDAVEEPYPLEPNLALSDGGLVSLGLRSQAAGPLGANITQTQVYTASIVNGNLQIAAGLSVAQAGSYALEGFLVDAAGNLINWARGSAVSLGVGSQALNLTFDGSVIRSHGIDGPYRVVALKVLAGGASYSVLDKVNIALTTSAYSHTQFKSPSAVIVFEDAMEAGDAQWTAGGAWNNATSASFSATHAWFGSDGNSSLRSGAIDLSHIAAPIVLRFQTAHVLNDTTDKGYVEVSTNGSAWTTLATLSTSSYWSTQLIDLSAYAYEPEFYVRFRLASSGGSANDAWAVDDVFVAGLLDSDADGLTDNDEQAYGTDPNDSDTDNDGLQDGEEVHTYATDPKDADTDNDGLTDGQEVNAYGTDPNDADTDNDGLTDGQEVNIYTTDPKDADTDNDGLTDGQEVNTYHTDPKDADTDNDDLTDGQEVNTYHTDPNDADTDNDGLTDGQEVNTYHTDPKDTDTDNDGLTDGEEVSAYNTDPTDADSDDDGLDDGDEIAHGTDPWDSDSDDDGYSDGEEVDVGTDPLDPASHPRRVFLPSIRR